MNITCQRLKELRKLNSYTQKEVADYLKINQSHLSKIENGPCNLNELDFEKICLLFDCSPDYLLGKSDHYESTIALREGNEKVDLNAIAKMNQILGHLKELRKLETAERHECFRFNQSQN